jgi:hypothetical protein
LAPTAKPTGTPMPIEISAATAIMRRLVLMYSASTPCEVSTTIVFQTRAGETSTRSE